CRRGAGSLLHLLDDHGVHVRLDAVGSDGQAVLHGVELPAVLAAVAAVEAVAVGPLGADVLGLDDVAVLDHVRVQGGHLDDGVLDVALGAHRGDDGVVGEGHAAPPSTGSSGAALSSATRASIRARISGPAARQSALSASTSVSAATWSAVGSTTAGAASGIGSTTCMSRLPRVAVRASCMRFSMCDRWLTRMPPTAMPPNLTSGSRYRRRRRPTYVEASGPHAATRMRRTVLAGRHGRSNSCRKMFTGCSLDGPW